MVMFCASLAGWPLPLLPIHILWVNMVTDGLPALGLGVDPIDRDVMMRPPRKPDEPIIAKPDAILMLVQGAFIAFCTLLAFWFVLNVEHESLSRARTAAFIVLSCTQLFHVFNCRSRRESIFKIGIFTNMKLVVAVLISLALQIAAVSLPFARVVFKTQALSAFDWFLVIIVSSLPLWAMEAYKIFLRKRV
jgi:Ca2+-transporting ATPase